jgi:hypothetical protein
MSAIALSALDPVSSSVVAFPDARRTALVARVAADLDRLEGDSDAADAYCDGVSGDLLARLAALGLDEDAQDEAIGAFFCAVEQARMELSPTDACFCCGTVHS